MNIKQMYEGWKNNLFPSEALKEAIKITSEERMSICNNCEFHSKNFKTIRMDEHCTSCGCTLSAKTKCLSCNCPINKWAAVINETEYEQIKKEYEDS